MKISNEGVLEIIQDILGSFLKSKPGLVDVYTSKDLRSQLDSLQSKWELIALGFLTGL